MSFRPKEVVFKTRRSILEEARRYVQRGGIYRATERYLMLIREYPNTPEGQEAKEAILNIAKMYGAEGKRYHSLSLYNKLAALAAERSLVGEERVRAWDKEAIEAVVRRYAEEVWGFILAEAARRARAGHGKRDEVPFVDLREEVDVTRNFERLGRMQRNRVDITPAVNALKELKGQQTD